MANSNDGAGESLEYALRYSAAGFCVLPLHSVKGGKCSCGKPKCESAGKHPRIPNGAHGASKDEAVIRSWFERWPDANVGMTLAGFVVVDVDPRHQGNETLDTLLSKYGQFPPTATQQTGGGGNHFMFRANPKVTYKGGAGAGVDLKHGAGQFIVVEPSIHASGNRYVWLDEEGPHEGGSIADAPGWLAGQVSGAKGTYQATDDTIVAGGRNNFLYERCRRFRDLGMRVDEIYSAALALNRRCVPPLSDNEVHTIAKSAALNDPDIKPLVQFVDGGEFVDSIVPPHWLVDGLIQRSYLYGMTAPTNHGKTALAALLAVSVGVGRVFGTMAVDAGHVLYLAGENPEDFKLRLRASCQASGLANSALSGRVTVMPVVGPLSEFTEQIKEFSERTPIALIIIDTSVAYFSYGDENANVDNRLHAQDMRSLIGCVGAPAVVALCHPVKNAAEDNLVPRGGSAFMNELDGNLTAYLKSDVITVSYNKLRGPPFQPLQFSLVECVIDGVQDKAGRAIKSVVARFLSESAAATAEQKNYDEMRVLLLEIKRAFNRSQQSWANLARACDWWYGTGDPDKAKVGRLLKVAIAEKLVVKTPKMMKLTALGNDVIEG